MFGDRYEIRLVLETATPLHIGTGELENIGPRPGEEEANAFATIVRDDRDLPYLPATSIKGALRRLAEQHFPGDAGFVPLFGKIPEEEQQGRQPGVMGRLLVRGGRVVGAIPDVSRAPFANPQRKASFIAARTAVDGEKGVADEHKLFHQEMVPPGLSFALVMTLLSFGKRRDNDSALDLLRSLLKVVVRDGLVLGRSQADGQGVLKVKGQVTITPYVLTGEGELTAGKPENAESAPAQKENIPGEICRRHFELLCAAPFAVVDSSVKGLGKDIAKEQGSVQLSAQRLTHKKPLLLGSSISGALRARVHWRWRLEVLRGSMKEAEKEDDDPVKELFGTSRRRALIEIRNLTVSEAMGEKITSLKVDRLTGAPVYGALFTTDTFTGTRVSFDLVLVHRGKEPSTDAQTIWQKLLVDVEKAGLQLGHGINKGFGWFKQEKAA
jgi:CRISPR/Cas system CSM-associated protein Csm3 (group 7 of RAMP superfamily)